MAANTFNDGVDTRIVFRAYALCIGEETVKTHVGSVLGKLQVENRAQAVVQALRRGLVTLEELT